MKILLLTQAVLNRVAKTPEGKAELRQKIQEAVAFREKTVREHNRLIGQLDALVNRMRLALGEVLA